MKWWLAVLLCAGCASAEGRGVGGGGGNGDGAAGWGGEDAGWTAGDGGADAFANGDGGANADANANKDANGNANDLAQQQADLAQGADLAQPPDLAHPPDLSSARPACHSGTGFAAFRFHYATGSTSPIIDAFGLPDSSNFEAVPVYSTSVVDPANGGGLEIASGNWLLIRFSVVGLTQINHATFSIYGRSYDVSASGSFDAWSPIYGDDSTPQNAVSNAWPYAWTSVDYTGHVQIGDDPGLTGIRLYSGPGSDDLAIHSVELCIDGY
jgi:hypothetical protein